MMVKAFGVSLYQEKGTRFLALRGKTGLVGRLQVNVSGLVSGLVSGCPDWCLDWCYVWCLMHDA